MGQMVRNLGILGHFLGIFFKSEENGAKREEVKVSAEIGHIAQHRRNESKYEHLTHTVHNGSLRCKHIFTSLFAGIAPILAFEYFRPEWDALIGRTETPHVDAIATVQTIAAHFLG